MVQKIQCIGVGVGEQGREWSLSHVWEVANVFLGSGRSNAAESLLIWCTENVKDLVELIDVISPLEEWAASKQFCKNASDGPDIDL